ARVAIEAGDVMARAAEATFDLATLHNNIYYFPGEARVRDLPHVPAFLEPGGRPPGPTPRRGERARLRVRAPWAAEPRRRRRPPRGSRRLVAAIVPYSPDALVDFRGPEPARACRAETAVAMARRAFARAARGSGPGGRPVGVGVTASLVTDRPKRGENRGHIAATDGARVDVVSLVLDKGSRDRAAEEDLMARAT